MNIYLVWERESYCDYDITYISQTKDEAIDFLEKLTGLKYDRNEPKDEYGRCYALGSWLIEEKEVGKYYELKW